MTNLTRVSIFFVVAAGVAFGASTLFAHRDRLEQEVAQLSVPEPVTVEDIENDETTKQGNKELGTAVPPDPVPNDPIPYPLTPNPLSFNLAIPFTSQAPHSNWALPWQEACEEASVLMAADFLLPSRVDLSNADKANGEILALVDFATKTLGLPIDTTAAETARVGRERYPELTWRIIENPSPEDIKREVAAGHPVIVPASGKKLGNPNFRNGGPVYHMFVVRGYTEKNFVTNDPGTRLGNGYVYRIETVMEAMGDWNGGDPAHGAKRVIVVE